MISRKVCVPESCVRSDDSDIYLMMESCGSAGSLQPEGQVRQQVRRRVRIAGEKVCEVCGDRALAHHFGALSCETCKAFFRRNAYKEAEIKPCSSDNNCEVNKFTRKQCTACRLKKCFDVGMKPELIMDEDQKRELNAKMQRTRLKRQIPTTYANDKLDQVATLSANVSSTLHMTGEARGSTITCPAQMLNNDYVPSACENGLAMNVCESQRPDAQYVHGEFPVSGSIESPNDSRPDVALHISLGHPGTEGFKPVGERSFLKSQESTSETVNGVPSEEVPQVWEHRLDVGLLSRDQLPSDPQMYWRLSEEERMILTLLSSAYENTVLSTLKERQTFPQFDMSKFTATDYLDEYDRQFRLMVSFVKQLEDFQKLKLDDQIACFKGSVGTVSLVRGAFVFVVERKAWIMVKGELTVEHMRSTFPDNCFLEWSTEVCHRLKDVAKNDIVLYALLHCILLFDPSIDKLADRQAVSVSRAKYIVLLRHYVESVFSYAYADDYMRFFQDMIVETRQLYKATVMAAKKKECSNTEECERYQFLMEIFSDSYS